METLHNIRKILGVGGGGVPRVEFTYMGQVRRRRGGKPLHASERRRPSVAQLPDLCSARRQAKSEEARV